MAKHLPPGETAQNFLRAQYSGKSHPEPSSVRITPRMFLVPAPGGGNDVIELGKSWFPAQFFQRPFGGGDQPGGIAGPARPFQRLDGLASDLLARSDHLANGITRTIAEVVRALLARFHREEVRLRQVNNVDVIANAGAV